MIIHLHLFFICFYFSFTLSLWVFNFISFLLFSLGFSPQLYNLHQLTVEGKGGCFLDAQQPYKSPYPYLCGSLTYCLTHSHTSVTITMSRHRDQTPRNQAFQLYLPFSPLYLLFSPHPLVPPQKIKYVSILRRKTTSTRYFVHLQSALSSQVCL